MRKYFLWALFGLEKVPGGVLVAAGVLVQRPSSSLVSCRCRSPARRAPPSFNYVFISSRGGRRRLRDRPPGLLRGLPAGRRNHPVWHLSESLPPGVSGPWAGEGPRGQVELSPLCKQFSSQPHLIIWAKIKRHPEYFVVLFSTAESFMKREITSRSFRIVLGRRFWDEKVFRSGPGGSVSVSFLGEFFRFACQCDVWPACVQQGLRQRTQTTSDPDFAAWLINTFPSDLF